MLCSMGRGTQDALPPQDCAAAGAGRGHVAGHPTVGADHRRPAAGPAVDDGAGAVLPGARQGRGLRRRRLHRHRTRRRVPQRLHAGLWRNDDLCAVADLPGGGGGDLHRLRVGNAGPRALFVDGDRCGRGRVWRPSPFCCRDRTRRLRRRRCRGGIFPHACSWPWLWLPPSC